MNVKSNGKSQVKSSAICLITLFCLWLTGCSSTDPARANFDTAQETAFWKPYLLYLQAKPHPKLYVEVDAVEGSIPSEKALDNLKHFLQTYCDKPAGIEIKRCNVIPKKVAQGFSPESLACRYMNDLPDKISNPAPAFMYVLYYDDALVGKPRLNQAAKAAAAGSSRYRVKNPHVDSLPYPAMIFFNTRYAPQFFNDIALLHEAGHLLGLVHRTTHASGHHCLDQNCIMARAVQISITRRLLGLDPIRQKELCAWCKEELAQDSKQVEASNLCFVGPVLVRSESGYHVLSLPGRVGMIVASSMDIKQQCQEFVADAREKALMQKNGETLLTVTADEDILRTPGKLAELIKQIGADPYDFVRDYAPGVMAQVGVRYYLAKGQFTNAVDICRVAIRLNTKNSEVYNSLAWIKCTCPDASVRDAKEALTAAEKACELSEWKDCRTIDTLAAAYAEAGNFTRAIQLEEQALRTGSPSDADQKELQDRLSHYKKSIL
jgi:tetratricopeptide (TPR) repeat protein